MRDEGCGSWYLLLSDGSPQFQIPKPHLESELWLTNWVWVGLEVSVHLSRSSFRRCPRPPHCRRGPSVRIGVRLLVSLFRC